MTLGEPRLVIQGISKAPPPNKSLEADALQGVRWIE